MSETNRDVFDFDLPTTPAESVAHDARTVGEILLERIRATPDRPACFQKIDGRWQCFDWRAFGDRARSAARGLVEDLGLEIGDRVAILGPTHTDWAVYDFGGHLAGCVTVGIYPKQAADQVGYLLDHSGCRAIFVADDEEMATVVEAAKDLDDLIAIIAWDDALAARWQDQDPRIEGPGRFTGEPLDADAVAERQAAIDPSSSAILIYTSGTTGPPKGAMITHDNILTLGRHLQGAFEYRQNDLVMAFLPMAHATERNLSFYGRVAVGVGAAYATSIGSVLAELSEVRPTVFGSVPRLFEKLYAKIQGDVEKASPTKRAIFRWGEKVARRRIRTIIAGESVPATLALQYAIASKLVFSKIHAALGGRVRICITGAAPISYEILEFLWGIDLPIVEGYGMTEATVITHINRLDSYRLGTVGQPIPTVEHQIAEDGEILLRGPLTFAGYHRNPEATAEALQDGWLHSGDIGSIDDDGFLRITDRKKHLIITAGGKNIAPANIERAIKNQSPMISQVHAHGDRRAFVSALIAPSPLETLHWGRENGLLDGELVDRLQAALMADPSARSPELNEAMSRVVADRRFQELFRQPVQSGNRDLARVERVRRYIVLERDFSVEGGELTPTMKMKRKVIEELYADRFERIYTEDDFAIDAEPATS